MGYYVNLVESNFTIPGDKVDAAFEALRALRYRTDLLTEYNVYSDGGFRHTDMTGQVRYSWMDVNFDETSPSAREIFDALGFEVREEDDGGFSLDYYDNKTGAERFFIEAAAPFANEDWYLIWRGEDGAMYKMSAEGTVDYEHVTVPEITTLRAENAQMRALLSRAVFTSGEDAVAAGRISGASSVFGAGIDGQEDIVQSTHEQSIDYIRSRVVGRR